MIENLGSSLDSFHPFMTGNHNIFSFLKLVGKPCLTTSRGKSQDYCGKWEISAFGAYFYLFS